MTKINTYNCNQIGGCVVTVETEKSKIVIDFGQNLEGSESPNIELEGLTFGEAAFDGVFFTHYHGDHIGRIKDILPDIPLYMGDFAKQALLNVNQALKNNEMIDLLKDADRITTITQNEPKEINDGDIVIIPYSVDHSAYEAFMFLIETPDKTILHTGDFRGHGYRGKKGLIPTIDKYIRANGKRDIDILITEGSMMNRTKETVLSEAELQRWASDLFKEHKYAFLICSSTNFDSLASFYHAGIKNRMHMYSNPYIISQLRTITEYTKKYGSLYQFDDIHTVDLEKELISKNGWRGKQKDLMRKFGFVCVIKEEQKYEKWIEEFGDLDPIVIYSMWDGYINPKQKAYNKELKEFCEKHKAISKHTSGHATKDVIAEVIKAVSPREAIIPIHTEAVEKFMELDIPEELKRKVKV